MEKKQKRTLLVVNNAEERIELTNGIKKGDTIVLPFPSFDSELRFITHKKKEWILLIKGYESYSNPTFIHDFFGKMTREEIGLLVYKHTDHHLRQFNS